MTSRKAITKKLRFEVFKRDAFTCQYCGRKAPDVLLHVDHINPVAAGGTNDFLNLITACVDCNSGKSDRKLSDTSVLSRQREQLEQLQERKEQIEMMFQWQKGLAELKDDVTDQLADFWSSLVVGFSLNDLGRKGLKKLERQFSVPEITEAMKIAVDTYVCFESGVPTKESVEVAWKKVGGVCTTRRRDKEDPAGSRLYYIRGILRNRLSYCNDSTALQLLRQAVEAGADVSSLERHAKEVRNWTQWTQEIYSFLESQEGKGAAPNSNGG